MVFLRWCMKLLRRANSLKSIILNLKNRMISDQRKAQTIFLWHTWHLSMSIRYSELFLLYQYLSNNKTTFALHSWSSWNKVIIIENQTCFPDIDFTYVLFSALRYQQETITLEQRSFSLTLNMYCSTFVIIMYFSKLLGWEEEE